MFSKESKVSTNKRMPDYDYIRKELLRNGVSKKLLWTEYMEDCRANGEEPLMYSQLFFVKHFSLKKRQNSLFLARDFPCFRQDVLCILTHEGMLHPVAFSLKN